MPQNSRHRKNVFYGTSVNHFMLQKSQVLESTDKSLKGSIDQPIVEVVQYINSYRDVVTTSSCSGRFSIVAKDGDSKKQCRIVYASHDLITYTDVSDAIEKSQDGNLTMKFEPFVLHVKCRTLDHAYDLLQCALKSGFKNSGIVLGRKSITLGVRSTLNMETQIRADHKTLVHMQYVEFLTSLVNVKLNANLSSINRFFDCLRATLEASPPMTEGDEEVGNLWERNPVDQDGSLLFNVPKTHSGTSKGKKNSKASPKSYPRELTTRENASDAQKEISAESTTDVWPSVMCMNEIDEITLEMAQLKWPLEPS